MNFPEPRVLCISVLCLHGKDILSPLFGEMRSVSLMNEGYNCLALWCRTSLFARLPISFSWLPYRVCMFLSSSGCQAWGCDAAEFSTWLKKVCDLHGQEANKVSEALVEKTAKLLIA